MRLEGKIALVTGSSRGLGKASALALAAEGATVVVTARTEEENPRLPGTIQQTVEEIHSQGGRSVAIRADLTVAEEVEALIQRVLTELGGVDILLHNAAAATRGRLVETAMRRWDILWSVNVRATMALVSGFYPAMKEQGGGHIIVVTLPPVPVAELTGGFSPSYRLSKNAAAQIAAVVAQEGRDDGIGACGIWPGTGQDTVGGRIARGWEQPRGLHASLFADAVVEIVTQDPLTYTGRFVTDEEVLRERGITDLSKYEPTSEDPAF